MLWDWNISQYMMKTFTHFGMTEMWRVLWRMPVVVLGCQAIWQECKATPSMNFGGVINTRLHWKMAHQQPDWSGSSDPPKVILPANLNTIASHFSCIRSTRFTEDSFNRSQLNQQTTMPGKVASKKGEKKAAVKSKPSGEKKNRKKSRKESYSIYTLQGSEASPPWHWNLLQGNEHHELLCQRHLRESSNWSFSSCSL